MNREDIIRMAREAGIGVEKDVDDWSVPVWHLGIDYLERFAALVAAAERERCYEFIGVLVEAEREACAKVCEAKRMVRGGEVFAAAIRARGEV